MLYQLSYASGDKVLKLPQTELPLQAEFQDTKTFAVKYLRRAKSYCTQKRRAGAKGASVFSLQSSVLSLPAGQGRYVRITDKYTQRPIQSRISFRTEACNEWLLSRFGAWQKAMELVYLIYALTKKFPEEEKYGLVSQLRRAAVSIPSNIAEG